jgi:dipeptidase E
MIMTSYGTSYDHHTLSRQTNKCLGIVDFAIHPHLDNEQFPNNSMYHYEKLAASLSMPSYLIDDQTAIKVIDDHLEVVSEGNWKFINPGRTITNSIDKKGPGKQ